MAAESMDETELDNAAKAQHGTAPKQTTDREERERENGRRSAFRKFMKEAQHDTLTHGSSHEVGSGHGRDRDEDYGDARALDDETKGDGPDHGSGRGDVDSAAQIMGVNTGGGSDDEVDGDVDGDGDDGSRPRYIRATVQAVGDRASQMLSATKSSSSVAKFTLDSVERLVEPMQSYTAGKWVEYGEPLLSSLDDKIDAVVEAIRGVTVSPPKNDASLQVDASSHGDVRSVVAAHSESEADTHTLYWDRLKRTFMESDWFQRVDNILTQVRLFCLLIRN